MINLNQILDDNKKIFKNIKNTQKDKNNRKEKLHQKLEKFYENKSENNKQKPVQKSEGNNIKINNTDIYNLEDMRKQVEMLNNLISKDEKQYFKKK